MVSLHVLRRETQADSYKVRGGKIRADPTSEHREAAGPPNQNLHMPASRDSDYYEEAANLQGCYRRPCATTAAAAAFEQSQVRAANVHQKTRVRGPL